MKQQQRPEQKQKALKRPSEWPPKRCPRCSSEDTKFSYFNNNSDSQPRYRCKACKRHWTDGGALRDIPIGGRSKKKQHGNTTVVASAASSEVAVRNLDAVPLAITEPAPTLPTPPPLNFEVGTDGGVYEAINSFLFQATPSELLPMNPSVDPLTTSTTPPATATGGAEPSCADEDDSFWTDLLA